MRVLIPDAPFTGEAQIEQEALAAVLQQPGAMLEIHRLFDYAAVPTDSWRRADAVIVASDRLHVGAETIGQLDACKVIVRGGVGFDNIDVEAATRRNIPVCNVPDYGTEEVADHAIALALALRRGVATYLDHLSLDPVAGWRFDAAPLVRRLRGQVCGIVGLGRIGRAVAARAQVLGCRVTYYDPYVSDAAFERRETLEALLDEGDIVSLHCPLNGETRGMIGAARLARMKPGALLVNTARGAVVDIDALPAALKAGRPGGAALDVLPNEPPNPDHELIAAWRLQPTWLAGRLLLTPHAAFYSPESLYDLRFKAAATARDALLGTALRHCVNRDGLDLARLAAPLVAG